LGDNLRGSPLGKGICLAFKNSPHCVGAFQNGPLLKGIATFGGTGFYTHYLVQTPGRGGVSEKFLLKTPFTGVRGNVNPFGTTLINSPLYTRKGGGLGEITIPLKGNLFNGNFPIPMLKCGGPTKHIMV